MGDAALLNAILRVHFSAANYNNLNPPAAGATQIDHFWEVQHVVAIIRPTLGDNWFPLPIGEFMDLSSFVNEHRNMFLIEAAINQQKKHIPLAQYRPQANNPLITAYLNRNLQGGGTVRDSVRALARAMRDRHSAYPRLTSLVGRELCALMGW